MPKHAYDSPQYLAQTFREYLNTPSMNDGIGLRAIQKGERVLFNCSGLECEVNFFQNLLGNMYSKIQILNKDIVHYFTIPVFVNRSKSGKISGNDFSEGYAEYHKILFEKIKEVYLDSK
jgi:hypothetical protein